MAICQYCGLEMTAAASCVGISIDIDGAPYRPVPFGDARESHGVHALRCGDCGVRHGGFHHPGCDMEECPRCARQLLSCDCLDDPDLDDFDEG
jgi:hypothetical protein